MEDFNLILKNLISRDIEDVNINYLTLEIKNGFEKTADSYVKNKNYLDAIKVFKIIDNKEKLNEVGNICFFEGRLYDSFYAFYYSDNKEKLNKIGEELLKIPDVENALKCFRKSENNSMVEFIEKNLAVK